MKKYVAYVDDGYRAYRVRVLAEDRADVKQQVHGIGDIVAIRDVTEDYPISIEKVEEALRKALFGDAEIDFIKEALTRTKVAD